MRFRRRKSSLEAQINLTSMIDIMFILNIFLLLNTYWGQEAGLPLNLPKATTGQPSAVEAVRIFLAADGTLSYKNQTLTLAQLEAELKNGNPTSPVILKADRDTGYGRTVEVFDLLRRLGYSRITLGTQPKKA